MTFVETTEQFIIDADWLRNVDQPAVQALTQIADALDTGKSLNASLVGQYRLIYNQLMELKPANDEGDDEDLFESHDE